MTSLRKGKYSSLIVFFNHSTGQYSEYDYSLEDAYEDMQHLGAQNTPSLIEFGDKTVSDYPTRIVSTFWIMNHGIMNQESHLMRRKTEQKNLMSIVIFTNILQHNQ